jgi:hypothetical protein
VYVGGPWNCPIVQLPLCIERKLGRNFAFWKADKGIIPEVRGWKAYLHRRRQPFEEPFEKLETHIMRFLCLPGGFSNAMVSHTESTLLRITLIRRLGRHLRLSFVSASASPRISLGKTDCLHPDRPIYQRAACARRRREDNFFVYPGRESY